MVFNALTYWVLLSLNLKHFVSDGGVGSDISILSLAVQQELWRFPQPIVSEIYIEKKFLLSISNYIFKLSWLIPSPCLLAVSLIAASLFTQGHFLKAKVL